MIALVRLEGGWSIAEIDFDEDGPDLLWWCGEEDEWVSPRSSWWSLSSCENEVFGSRAEAERFAKRKGWLPQNEGASASARSA